MLGGVKGDPEAENVPLFRLLAQRWVSLAPVKRERLTALSRAFKDERPRQARAWISKARAPIHSPHTIEPATSKRAWNPWLWIK